MKYFDHSEIHELAHRVAHGEFWFPRIVRLSLSEWCNWRCRMCQCDKQERPILSSDQWIAIARNAVKHGAKEIGFTGGEATMYPGLEKILEGISDLQQSGLVRFKLLSNGSRLNRGRVDRFFELGLTRYIISLHGASPTVHDEIVGVPGAWNGTVQGIKNIASKAQVDGGSVWINCVLQRSNLSELPDLMDLAANIGCEGVSLSPLDNRTAACIDDQPSLDEMAFARLNTLPLVRKKAQQTGLLLFPESGEPYGSCPEEEKVFASGNTSRGYYENHPCYWVFYHVTIASDGTVHPCCNIPIDPAYGNAVGSDLQELTNTPEAKQFLAGVSKRPAVFDACRTCEMKLQVNQSIHEQVSGLSENRETS